MTPEFFRHVAREAAPFTERIYTHLMGEPLLHPEFSELISICGETGVDAAVTTNGTLLDKEREAALLSGVVSQVNFSLHGIEELGSQTDSEFHLEKILRFVETSMKENPELYINLRFWNLDKDGMIPSAKRWMMEAVAQRLAIDESIISNITQPSRKIRGRLYLNFEKRFDWPRETSTVRTTGFCHALSDQCGILVDGTVVPCCLDNNGTMPLGNVKDQSLETILSSSRSVTIRNGFAKGELVEDTCRRCSFCEKFNVKAAKIIASKKKISR